ncbi:flagellar hook-basal body complex protein FliE [Desulfocurvus sp. DL9XJH121]
MAIQNVALNAYKNALESAQAQRTAQRSTRTMRSVEEQQHAKGGFSEVISDSLKRVNDLQTEKHQMIQEFASGENQNVHELMISLQKAGLAMKMTSAVRNKVMEAYKELSRTSF